MPGRGGAPADAAAPGHAQPDLLRPRLDRPDPPTPRNTIRLTQNQALIGVAGLVLVVVAAWWLGNATGRWRADAAWRRQFDALDAQRNPIVDALADIPLNNQLLAAPLAAGMESPAGDQGSTPGQGTSDTGTPSASAAPVREDPRVPGLNYLQLVTTSRDEAERIVAFLGRHGVPALAVPARVDSAGDAANNRSRYAVFSLRGITASEYGARAGARQEHEAVIARLGAAWKRDHGGSSDFTGAIWAKYSP